MNNNEFASLMFPNIKETPEQLELKYPQRSLPEGAKVTRIAPSPTGFMHLGNLYGAIADERLAHQSKGIFYLRIEDTDQKREVEGGVETIINVFKEYKLNIDEGAGITSEKGDYGPYRQRQRADIYHVCAKWLLEQGMAYPCFMSEQELEDMRRVQADTKENFGCYGKYAKYRNYSWDEAAQRIKNGEKYVLRFSSPGCPANKVKVTDLVRGVLEMPENDQDVVLLKSDGIPTYHFAHIVDDHFMRTTHTVRGEEWLATLPIHLQLFNAMGWRAPKYLHTAHLMKQEGNSKRKLSKRKDPELALDFYKVAGYSIDVLKEYMMTLLNSNYEEWRRANQDKPLEDFPFSIKKMAISGTLFDIDKLNDISRDIISKMSVEAVYNAVDVWSQSCDPAFNKVFVSNPNYTKTILGIGRGGKKPRKDITVWSDVKEYIGFFFKELFAPNYDIPANVSTVIAKEILELYEKIYDPADDQVLWFDKIQELADKVGFASDMKAYKLKPDGYIGHVGDVSMVLRVALAGRQNSPDMREIMLILGRDNVIKRLRKMRKAL